MSGITDKVKQQLAAKHGISSGDIAAIVASHKAAEAPEEEEKRPVGEEMSEPSVVKAEKPEELDPVDKTAEAERLDDQFFYNLARPESGKVELTPVEKAAFVDAVLSNGRMKLNFSLLGGRFNFTVKNRTYEEARAAVAMAQKQSVLGEMRSLFSMRLRLMLMCFQIDEMNGVSYPDADTLGPLLQTYVDNKLVQPKWLERLDVFGKLPEAMFEAVWACIREFELKYWTLVKHSRDQDFWLPG